MEALIPQKDTLFQLAVAAKECIAAYNAKAGAGGVAWPSFPLWAFTEDGAALDGAYALTIAPPQSAGQELFFPVRVDTPGASRTLRIVFATTRTPALPVPDARSVAFPLTPRVFRTATVTLRNNGWQAFEERWHKCAALTPSPSRRDPSPSGRT